jgi:hypothetical protein
LSANIVQANVTRLLEALPERDQTRGNWGTALFRKTVILHVKDAPEPLVVELEKQMVLGRIDPQNPQKPDLDLTPYGAVENGVSRRHARIEHQANTLSLTDLGSANGTLLNGHRLPPEQSRLLRDGDEITLGRLVINIFFK